MNNWPAGLCALSVVRIANPICIQGDCIALEFDFGIISADLDPDNCDSKNRFAISETGLIARRLGGAVGQIRPGEEGEGILFSAPAPLHRLVGSFMTFCKDGEKYFIAIWNGKATIDVASLIDEFVKIQNRYV